MAIPDPDLASSLRRREFLTGLPHTHREDDCLYLHGSPRDPVHEYLFPEDICNQWKMHAVFAIVDRYCFMGHTHLPGIFTEDLQFLPPTELDGEWQVNGHKTLCNVGSVGQPRDGDRWACYVLFDGASIRFRRVAYDIDKTISKINGLDDFPRE